MTDGKILSALHKRFKGDPFTVFRAPRRVRKFLLRLKLKPRDRCESDGYTVKCEANGVYKVTEWGAVPRYEYDGKGEIITHPYTRTGG